jgi:hypothetical protein
LVFTLAARRENASGLRANHGIFEGDAQDRFRQTMPLLHRRLQRRLGDTCRQRPCWYRRKSRLSLISLQLPLAPVVVFAIGIEDALGVPVDRRSVAMRAKTIG